MESRTRIIEILNEYIHRRKDREVMQIKVKQAMYKA